LTSQLQNLTSMFKTTAHNKDLQASNGNGSDGSNGRFKSVPHSDVPQDAMLALQ